MANVHTLGEFSHSTSNPNRAGSISIPISDSTPREPRCIDLFFPGFHWHSFIVWISVVQAICFILSLVLGSYALSPTMPTLNRLGASYGPDIKHGQVWRLITPLLLHANMWHILFNVFFQIRMGLPIERDFGLKKFVYLYLLAGLSGNCLSVAWAFCKSSVGASTAGFGLIGVQMAAIALTWHVIDRKDQVIFNITFFVLISLIVSISPSSHVDWRGHLGGFVGGFALGVLYQKDSDQKPTWYDKAQLLARIGLPSMIVACILVSTWSLEAVSD